MSKSAKHFQKMSTVEPPASTPAANSAENFSELHRKFFDPLSSQDGYYLSFPGFGFWTRDYAEFLANFTEKTPEMLANNGKFCEVISYLFHYQHGVNNTEMCPPFWDDLSCFPATPVGQISVIPCPEYILNTPYDTSSKL